jgi:hypothetical protein
MMVLLLQRVSVSKALSVAQGSHYSQCPCGGTNRLAKYFTPIQALIAADGTGEREFYTQPHTSRHTCAAFRHSPLCTSLSHLSKRQILCMKLCFVSLAAMRPSHRFPGHPSSAQSLRDMSPLVMNATTQSPCLFLVTIVLRTAS